MIAIFWMTPVLHNTAYLGNVRVNCQLTVGAGDLTEMSVFGAASNWDAVNERC
jgi:hypothetical protein